MNVPDYISPIIGYRVWRWDDAGLRSLNGKAWSPRKPLAAKCGAGKAHDAHGVPQTDCTCGVYASKSLEQLLTTGYAKCGIHGEVYLWGTVVEHELGYRAQFAYPKPFVLPPDTLPFTLAAIQAGLRGLVAYGIHIFGADANGNIPLWTKHSGLDPTGLDYLIEIGKESHVRRKRDRILRKGDRLAVLGRGTAVVEHVNSEWIQAVVLNNAH